MFFVWATLAALTSLAPAELKLGNATMWFSAANTLFYVLVAWYLEQREKGRHSKSSGLPGLPPIEKAAF
jgi:hypothetical protein